MRYANGVRIDLRNCLEKQVSIGALRNRIDDELQSAGAANSGKARGGGPWSDFELRPDASAEAGYAAEAARACFFFEVTDALLWPVGRSIPWAICAMRKCCSMRLCASFGLRARMAR